MEAATATELEIAEAIARKAHDGQKDTVTGAPYITHVERVVSMLSRDDTKAVGWLHDVLEDSNFTAAELLRAGISERVVDAVEILTRVDNNTAMITQTYAQYIDSIKASRNLLALAVKLADLNDHLHPNCPARLRTRYEAAWQTLMGAPWKQVQEASCE
jgi:(p)ppGpp synthase/HD superfamily hydrolase